MSAESRRARRTGLRNTFSRRGYYGRRLAEHRAVFLWSALLALLCTLITYPGIWYSDSYVRVETGGAVLNAMVKTLTGHRAPLETGNAFTLIPSFFMALSRGLTGHVALYTFGQAFAFFAAVFLLIRELNPRRPGLQRILFAVCPVVYGMSVYYEAGVGCVTGLAALMLLFRRAGDPKEAGDRALELLLVALSSFVTFGYRTNALTVVPVLAFFLIRAGAERRRKALMLASLVLGLAMTKAVPWLFDVHSLSTASAGIVWEMIMTIQRMAPEDREKYADFLDEIGGEGSTRAALEITTDNSAGTFMWGQDLGIEKMSAPGATGTALRKYAQLMAERPGDFFAVKADVILRSLGLRGELDLSEYSYNRWDQMQEYGMTDSLQRRAFYNSVVRTFRVLGFYTLHPWVPFLGSAGLLAAEALRRRKRGKSGERGDAAFALTFWMAAFYYLAYLLDTPAYDFRYFYPSLLLLAAMDFAVVQNWICALLPPRGKAGGKGAGHAAAGHHSGVQ